MSYTASVNLHCMTIRIQPPVREVLSYEARALGVGVPEKIREILLQWAERHPQWRDDLARR